METLIPDRTMVEEGVSNQENVEFKQEGVNYTDDTTERVKRMTPQRGRRLCNSYVPKIYVNDGSNGINLVNTYSHKVYNSGSEKPSVTNSYTNNFKTSLTSSTVYDSVNGNNLHKHGDHGAYRNFTISHFIPLRESPK